MNVRQRHTPLNAAYVKGSGMGGVPCTVKGYFTSNAVDGQYLLSLSQLLFRRHFAKLCRRRRPRSLPVNRFASSFHMKHKRFKELSVWAAGWIE